MGASIKDVVDKCKVELESIYPAVEAKEIALRLVEDGLKIGRHQLLGMLLAGASNDLVAFVESAMARLLANEPLQYIAGEVEFYGCLVKVTPSVLIPRPETEELVDMIVKEWKGARPTVIDFGTGSGCIPVSLAKHIPNAVVFAVDISSDALAVASANAMANDVKVTFVEADMLTFDYDGEFDLIVSNPPYVMESEKEQMRPNVLLHEPHLALFVPDNDPLLFYRYVASFASTHLAKGGAVYLEINQQLGKETCGLFEQQGMKAIVMQDLFGVDRFVKAVWA